MPYLKRAMIGGRPRLLAIVRDISERKRVEAAHHFLAGTGEALAASLDYEATLEKVARLTVPFLGDVCIVDTVEESGEIRRVAVAHADPQQQPLADRLCPYAPRPDTPGGAAEVIRTRRSLLIPVADEKKRRLSALNDEHLRVMQEIGTRSYLVTPLVARGRALGALSFLATRPGRRFSAVDLALAEELARRAAVDNARLYREAHEANEAKDRFITLVSHELRTPLSAMRAGMEVLRRAPDDPERVRRTVATIDRNVRLQARLIDDLLDLSRIARGKVQLQRAPVALDAVVRSAAQDQQAEAERADLILRLSLAEGLWVMGDFDRLQQIVLNLLTNAIKFTPVGGEVRVSVQRQEERGRIVVEDTGIGIDPALRGHLFEMFRQGDVAGQHRPGLGIGLALTKSLTEMHGGQVWAESEGAGKDSRFTVELPLIPAPVKPGGRDERGPIHALLVEDNPDTHCLLQDGLELAGYTVDAAESAKEALTRLARTTPDLILADIGLPGMDGYEMLRHARQMPGLARVPAFAVTALGQDEDVRRAQEAGYEGHFVKPVDVTVLSERIRGRLAARSTTLTDRLTPARTTPADPPPAR